MRYYLFIFGLIFWLIFAYDVEHDKDFFTWMWLLLSLYFFTNSFVRYQYDMNLKKEVKTRFYVNEKLENDHKESIIIFEKGESKTFSKEQVETFEKIVERSENDLMFNTNHYHWITFHLSINGARVNYPINFSTLWTANSLLKQKGLVTSIEATPLDEETYNKIVDKKLW